MATLTSAQGCNDTESYSYKTGVAQHLPGFFNLFLPIANQIINRTFGIP